MIRNYLVVAIRNLLRNRLHAAINIVGLAIGMTCCMLITLYVQFELGYDRQNKDAARIYRMGVDLDANNWAISAFPIGQLLKDNFPEVEKFTRIKPIEVFVENTANLIKNKERVFFADSSVFDVLDIKLIKGDPAKALGHINSMVLTPEKARTYFGDEDPIGKTLRLLNTKQEYQITGIFQPLPANSHVHMNMMVSSDNFPDMRSDSKNGWNYLTNHYTYLVLPKGIDRPGFEKKISAFLDAYQKTRPDERRNVLRIQPITSIHLHSNLGLEVEANGNINTVYILSAIAFFILVIACINFMNLTTAQSLKRAKEVGIRKVVGSGRGQLVFQFLSESVVISFGALLITILLLVVVLPAFNDLSGKAIELNPLTNGFAAVCFLGITFFVGVVAGTYPAFFLSGFKPVLVLKGSFSANLEGQTLRKGLVVFQFAIAFIIMVGTYVVYDQLHYMLHKDLGFDREQTLILKMPRDSVGVTALKTEIEQLADVQAASFMFETPGDMVGTTGMWYEGLTDDKNLNMYVFSGDADLLRTLNMKMVAGDYFKPGTQRPFKEFVINETAVKRFGWKNEEAIGKLMEFGGRGKDPGKVIGVVQDFHFKDLHDVISPLAMYLAGSYEGQLLAVKLRSADMQASVEHVRDTWKRVLPQEQLDYRFLDQSFDRLFQQEKTMGQLFSVFSCLAIFVSCLGLFGLASFTLEQTRKSVAVRKVLGASAANILFMMSRDFLKLVIIGMVIAAPVAWFAMNRWLQGFAYNVGFGWIVFVYAAIAALAIAMATVSYHSLKAATSNPVNALKEQ
jgi:putative ABC transport system permease protein